MHQHEYKNTHMKSFVFGRSAWWVLLSAQSSGRHTPYKCLKFKEKGIWQNFVILAKISSLRKCNYPWFSFTSEQMLHWQEYTRIKVSEGTTSTYKLLNVYCEIFGTSSYGEGRTSLRVRLHHMNECRMFHNIHSMTFLLYTLYSNLLVSSVLSL